MRQTTTKCACRALIAVRFAATFDHVGTRKPIFAISSALILLLQACTGGQTGQPTIGDEICQSKKTELVSLSEAEAQGFAVGAALDEVLGPARDKAWDLLFTGSTTLWTDRGLVPPPDRSTPVRLSAHSLDEVEITRRELAPDLPAELAIQCSDTFAISLAATLELTELQSSLESTGRIRVDPRFGAGVEVRFDFFDSCILGALEDGALQLLCNGGPYALSACLEPGAFVPLPVEPTTGSSIGALVARACSVFPTTLSCEGEGPSSVTLEGTADVPTAYCPVWPSSTGIPMVFHWKSSELGLDGIYPAVISQTNGQIRAGPATKQPMTHDLPWLEVSFDADGTAMVSAGFMAADYSFGCHAEAPLE